MRRCIARTIPGPDHYLAGDSWASAAQVSEATPEQQQWLMAVASGSSGVDHREMPGVAPAGRQGAVVATADMIVATTETIPGFRVARVIGLVSASAVRTRDFGAKIGSSVRDVVGGEHRTQTGLVEETFEQARARTVERARQLGANGIIGIRVVSSDIFGGSAEFTLCGTAVTLERIVNESDSA